MTKRDYNIRRLSVGDALHIELPYSEVCMHMGVAGKVMRVEVLDGNMAQLWDARGVRFSSPITQGEAGIYTDAKGLWSYEGTYQRSLVIVDMLHFQNVIHTIDRKIERKDGYNRTLMDNIAYLLAGHYSRADELVLYPDGERDFSFQIKRGGVCRMNGGIILHGAGEAFAVELSPQEGVYYSIHT